MKEELTEEMKATLVIYGLEPLAASRLHRLGAMLPI